MAMSAFYKQYVPYTDIASSQALWCRRSVEVRAFVRDPTKRLVVAVHLWDANQESINIYGFPLQVNDLIEEFMGEKRVVSFLPEIPALCIAASAGLSSVRPSQFCRVQYGLVELDQLCASWSEDNVLGRRPLENQERMSGSNGSSSSSAFVYLQRLASASVTHNSAVVNKHARDTGVSFEESSHTYYLHSFTSNRKKFPMSVSTVWERYFPKFNPDEILRLYYDRWCYDATNKYHKTITEGRSSGMSHSDIRDHIKEIWRVDGETASALGTYMHRQIELALNGEAFDGHAEEMKQFNAFVQAVLQPRGWVMYRTEWSVYDETIMVAGQIDAVFKDAAGELHMVDWKRCKEPLHPDAKQNFGRYGYSPCEALIDNACVHYFLQQNLYMALLRRRYGLQLRSMSLVQLHPAQSGYRMLQVPDWFSLANELLERSAETVAPQN